MPVRFDARATGARIGESDLGIKTKFVAVGAGILFAVALVIAPAAAASAVTLRGPYNSLSDCQRAMVTMDNKGYTITRGCFWSYPYGKWMFHTA
jgi:hypothetical protein